MRKWHRWLSLFFGAILLWVAVTGVLSQVVPLVLQGGGEQAAAAPPADFACPETMVCRPKRPGSSTISLLHHLHSGESLGPVGVALFTLAGFAMVFFAFSGLWLYVQMFRFRKTRGLTPAWLWK